MTDWTTEDPALKAKAPYEPSAVYRLHKAGHPSQAILETFRMRGSRLIKEYERSQLEAQIAEDMGLPIHLALIPKEKT